MSDHVETHPERQAREREEAEDDLSARLRLLSDEWLVFTLVPNNGKVVLNEIAQVIASDRDLALTNAAEKFPDLVKGKKLVALPASSCAGVEVRIRFMADIVR